MYPDIKSFAGISFSLRTLVLFSNLLAPYGFYVSISVTGPSSLSGAVYSMSSGLILALVLSYCFTQWKKKSYSYIAAGIGVLITEGIWLALDPFHYMMVVYLFLIACFMVRFHLVVESSELDVSVRKALRSDTAFVVATIFVLLFAQSGSKAPNYGPINTFTGVVCICAIVLRMVVMWILHQDHTKGNRGAKAVLVTVFTSVLASFVLFQKSLLGFVVLIAAILIIIAIPYIRGLRRELIAIVGMILVASTFLFFRLPKKSHPTQLHHEGVVSGINREDWLRKIAMQAHTKPFLFDGLLVLLVIWIGWIVVKRYLRQTYSTPTQNSVQLVSRGWIRKKGRDRMWTRTDHPIRIRYQKWLQELTKKGWPIQQTETAHQYHLRVKNVETGYESIDSAELTRLYEQARYGE